MTKSYSQSNSVPSEMSWMNFRQNERSNKHSTTNNKAARLDGIQTEMYKHGGETLVANLLDRYRRYSESGELPQDFKDALIVIIYKLKLSRNFATIHCKQNLTKNSSPATAGRC